MNFLQAFLANFGTPPRKPQPLDVIDHGDADAPMLFAPTLFRTPVAHSVFMAGQKVQPHPASFTIANGGDGERIVPASNKAILTTVAPESFWLEIERSVLGDL